MYRKARRVDANQKELTAQIRELGYFVYPTHFVGSGYTDLTVCYKGVTILVEVKSDEKSKLTPDEVEFSQKFDTIVCYDIESFIQEADKYIARLFNLICKFHPLS